MKKLEACLAKLGELRAGPLTPEAVAQLQAALAHKNNHVVAAAAEIAGEAELADLEPDLVAAFARFMRKPAKSDPGCQAKRAIVEALTRVESAAEDVFVRGIRHVQMEPTWGGQADTAAPLRGACAMALVSMRHRDALLELAALLADPEPDARIAAARALAYAGDPASVPLLRFKVLTGDAHPQVLHECFASLLKLDADTSLPFVTPYLESEDAALAESAALALGASRAEGALDALAEAWENTFDAEFRRTLLLAIATLRRPEAIEHLLDIVRHEARVHADAALEALQMYRRDERIWQQVQAALAEREDRS